MRLDGGRTRITLSRSDTKSSRRYSRAREHATYLAAEAVPALVAEVRRLRSLLATAAPCGWPTPEARDGVVAWDSLDGLLDADEAVAIGAALVRAGLEARHGQ